jgi:hypothetical protein
MRALISKAMEPPNLSPKFTIRACIEPILEAIPAVRQEFVRHYGVHPYFTRRPANVVRAYIERYSQEGDVVLDPFGGTGVTAIEAFLLGRSAIQNDLNPFANFIARNIADTTLPSTAPLRQAFERVEQNCSKAIHEIEKDETIAKELLKKLPLPENIRLPRNSDADFYYDMFTPRQLAGLALIKQAIDRETAYDCGGELKAAITQTGDVIWSMHKKKNSASVLAGEMILTFYKPAKIPKTRKLEKTSADGDAAVILSEVFDACLNNEATSFTSEALFNRLVIELWRRRALSCLNLDREEFAKQLERRGWSYNTRTHSWSKAGYPKKAFAEMMLFDRERD